MFNTIKLLMATVIICHVVCANAEETVISNKRLPLYMSLDGKKMLATSLYLRCDIEDCNGKNYHDIDLNGSNKPEVLFKQIVNNVKKDNPTALLSLSCDKESVGTEKSGEHKHHLQQGMSGLKELLASDAIGGDLSKLRVYHEIFLGNCGYIIYGNEKMDKNELPFRPMIKFRQEASQVYWDVDAPTKTRFLVQMIVNQMARNPEKFAENQDKKTFDYEIPFPGAEEGRVAYLDFNGDKYNIDVSKQKIDPADKVARLFQMQFEYVKQSREALIKLYGGRAQVMFRQWIESARRQEKTGGDMLSGYFQDMKNVDRILRFILKADPLYIVFYQKKGSENLEYQIIIRDPINGKIGFRNTYVYDFFRQWFDTPDVQSSFRALILQ